MTDAEDLETILSQEEQVHLDGNVVALLTVRKYYNLLKQILATQVRASGEIMESTN